MYNDEDMLYSVYKEQWETADAKCSLLEEHILELCDGINKAMIELSPDSPAYIALKNALSSAKIELINSSNSNNNVLIGVKHMGEEIASSKDYSKDYDLERN